MIFTAAVILHIIDYDINLYTLVKLMLQLMLKTEKYLASEDLFE